MCQDTQKPIISENSLIWRAQALRSASSMCHDGLLKGLGSSIPEYDSNSGSSVPRKANHRDRAMLLPSADSLRLGGGCREVPSQICDARLRNVNHVVPPSPFGLGGSGGMAESVRGVSGCCVTENAPSATV